MQIKKTIFYLFITSLAALWWMGCGKCDGNCGKSCCSKMAQTTEMQENPQPWQPLYDEVMRVHDAVMPKMGDINKLQKELKHYRQTHEADLDASEQKNITALVAELKKGEEAMWDWMHAFKQPEKDENLDQVNNYLRTELTNITEVSDLMLRSIRDAESFLETKK